MWRWHSSLLAYVLAGVVTHTHAAAVPPQPCMNCSISATGPGTTSHIIGFVLNYKTSVLPIASINGALFTEIVYQGFDIVEGRCAVDNAWFDTQQTFGSNALGDDTNAATPYRGNFYQLRLLKQQAGNAGRLRTLVSIGGYSFSTNVSVIAASDAGRHLLASSCTQLARYYGFDGVEIRWQYPVMGGAWMNVHSPADKANLPLLLAAFRTEDPGLLLTANVNFNAGTLYPRYDLAGIANQVDWIHADTFGLYGTWSTSTAHYANLFFTVGSPSSDTVDGLVVQALAAGVPPCKFILGVPLSYPAWKLTSNVPASFPALFAPGTTYTAGATDNGLFRYRDAMQLCSGAPSSCTVVWDASSNASVLYDPSSLVWIPVESAQTMAAKAAYIAANNLGGVIFTDVSGDTSAFDIVTAMQVALKGSAPCLGQPAYVPSGGAVPSYARQAPGACAPVRASSTSGGMATPALQTATRVIGRYASYKDAYLPVAAIDGSLLTHVIYESAGANASWQCQFASPVNDLVRVFGANTLGNDTGDPYHGDVNQLRRLKLKYPHLTTILQLGQNVMFSSLVSDAGRRSAFVSSCVAMMQQYGFDGLNVNWNSPMLGASYQNDPHLPTDRTQLPVLMQMFRAQMPPGALLSLTVTVQADTMYAAYDLPAIVPHVDFIEYANEWMWGTWSPVPGHLNPLHFNAASPEYYSIEANVVQLLNWGVPHCKLVLGLPVYGAAWNLSAPIPGPFYPGVFAATGSAYATGATDVAQHYRYGDLLALRQAATPGAWLDQWDPVSQAAFLYNAGSGIVVSYENPASIAAKAAFVKVMALGGFAVDDLDADADNFALLHSAVRAMLVVPAPSTRSLPTRTTTTLRRPVRVPSTSGRAGKRPTSSSARLSIGRPRRSTSPAAPSTVAPPVSIQGPAAPHAPIDVAQTLILTAVLSPAAAAAFDLDRDTLRWSIHDDDDDVAAGDPGSIAVLTSLSDAELRLAPCALRAGARTYTFTVTLTLGGAVHRAQTSVTTAPSAWPAASASVVVAAPAGRPITALVDTVTLSVPSSSSTSCAVFYAMMRGGAYPSALGDGACLARLQTVLPVGDASNGYALNITAVLAATTTPGAGQRSCATAAPVTVVVRPPAAPVDVADLVAQRLSLPDMSEVDVACAAASLMNAVPTQAATATRLRLLGLVAPRLTTTTTLTPDATTAAAWALAMIAHDDDDNDHDDDDLITRPMASAALDAVHAFISGWAAPLSASARMATSLTTASCLRVLSREGEVPRAAQAVVERVAVDTLNDVDTASQCTRSCRAPIRTSAFVVQAYRVDAYAPAAASASCATSCRVDVPLALRARYAGVSLGVVSTSWAGTGILSVSVYANGSSSPAAVTNLPDPVTMVMPVVSERMTPGNVACMWLSADRTTMSGAGCTVVAGPPLACACTHLTDFVLVERPSPGDDATLGAPVSIAFSAVACATLATALACAVAAPRLIANRSALRSFRVMNALVVGRSALRLLLLLVQAAAVPDVGPYVARALAALTQSIQFAAFAYLIALLATIWASVEDMAGRYTPGHLATLRAIAWTLRLTVALVAVSPGPLLVLGYALRLPALDTLAAAVVCASTAAVALVIPVTGGTIATGLAVQFATVGKASTRANSYMRIAAFVRRLTTAMGLVLLGSSLLWTWSLAWPASYRAQVAVAEPAFLTLDAAAALLAIVYQLNILATQYRKAQEEAVPANDIPVSMISMMQGSSGGDARRAGTPYRTASQVTSTRLPQSLSSSSSGRSGYKVPADDPWWTSIVTRSSVATSSAAADAPQDTTTSCRSPWEDLLSDMATTFTKKADRYTDGTTTTTTTMTSTGATTAASYDTSPVYEALYDFVGDAKNGELSFAAGDLFDRYRDTDEGWGFACAADGRRGYIPRAYVRLHMP